MANELQTTIIGTLEQTAAVIRTNMQAKDINASGRTSASIRVRTYEGGFQLVGGGQNTAPFATVEVGRPGGNVPGGMVLRKNGVLDVSNTFKAILMQWAKDKGLDMDWGGATMLGRRIAAIGTLRHRQNVDVYSTEVKQAATTIRNACNAHVSATIRAAIGGTVQATTGATHF